MIITGGSALWLACQACPAPRIRGNLILVCCNTHLLKNVRVFYYMGALLSCLGSQTPVFLLCCPLEKQHSSTSISQQYLQARKAMLTGALLPPSYGPRALFYRNIARGAASGTSHMRAATPPRRSRAVPEAPH